MPAGLPQPRLRRGMDKSFFEHPILNSPYAYPGQHWELEGGLPTNRVIANRRRAELLSPIPKAKKQKAKKGKQAAIAFEDTTGLDDKQLYELAIISVWTLGHSLGSSHGCVVMGTMHQAKGLEFRAVVVMACDDDLLPLQSRIETATDEGELEEIYATERQLLYVACTRARDHLLVTGVRPGSEFLGDMAK